MSTAAPSGLRRQVTLPELIAYGLVFIGPAAAVGVFGPLDAKSHGVVPIVYLVATIAMAFTAASYVLMSREVPSAGSVYAYARAGIGPRAGFFTGWIVMLDYLLIPSVAYLFTGIAMNSLVPVVPVWVWTAGAVALTTAMNLAGSKIAARAATIVVVAEVIVLGLVLIVGVWHLATVGPSRGWLTPLTGIGVFSWQAVFAAVSVAVLSYLGFDAIATFAEETVGSSRVVGRATLVCLVLAGALFILQTYIGALLMEPTPAELAANPELQGPAYYTAVGEQLSPILHTLLAVAKGIGAAFSAMVGQAAASRILLGMGRTGALPSALTRVSERTGVPMRGILFAATANVALAVWAATRADGLDLLVSIVDVGALVAFTLLHASVIGWFWAGRRHAAGAAPVARSVLRHLILPLIGAAILIAVLVNASTIALIVGAVWTVVGVVVMLVRGPGSLDDPAVTRRAA
ncbi:APC family permease [Helcobacillus massiliensis]|uniref:APC family permease n=1 Tax=Helcobacillus TaxID=1161125 RepID=UPI001EF630F2|nr:APC family permease [Helcobacillus massiliensis]MCG7427213.1 APC family permease [Helcobacillus sp. ACRRO]MCT1556828.1 APC family permease [Helcobacillus massiliensis]MCT2035652.1 APC family permease [Helcobacillus massiliensis]MCT2330896.1 APC family permease [Helcobacillus massiliensis]MDK7741276.1 APC family permease [Helcobacillus massiliensis]